MNIAYANILQIDLLELDNSTSILPCLPYPLK